MTTLSKSFQDMYRLLTAPVAKQTMEQDSSPSVVRYAPGHKRKYVSAWPLQSPMPRHEIRWWTAKDVEHWVEKRSIPAAACCLRGQLKAMEEDYAACKRAREMGKKVCWDCKICLEQIGRHEHCETMDCGHVFHSDCVEKWFRIKNARICPHPVCSKERAVLIKI